MHNMHSREDAFDPEARTEAQDIALRDALLRRYPLQPARPRYVAEQSMDQFGWVVVRADTKLVGTCIAADLTEEHARIFADALNATDATVDANGWHKDWSRP